MDNLLAWVVSPRLNKLFHIRVIRVNLRLIQFVFTCATVSVRGPVLDCYRFHETKDSEPG